MGSRSQQWPITGIDDLEVVLKPILRQGRQPPRSRGSGRYLNWRKPWQVPADTVIAYPD
jgi:hypothetical protein